MEAMDRTINGMTVDELNRLMELDDQRRRVTFSGIHRGTSLAALMGAGAAVTLLRGSPRAPRILSTRQAVQRLQFRRGAWAGDGVKPEAETRQQRRARERDAAKLQRRLQRA